MPTTKKLMKISEHAACWGIVARAMHTRLQEVEPDQRGAGVRGSASLYSAEVVARVMLGDGAARAIQATLQRDGNKE